jgi:hypothetical protein
MTLHCGQRLTRLPVRINMAASRVRTGHFPVEDKVVEYLQYPPIFFQRGGFLTKRFAECELPVRLRSVALGVFSRRLACLQFGEFMTPMRQPLKMAEKRCEARKRLLMQYGSVRKNQTAAAMDLEGIFSVTISDVFTDKCSRLIFGINLNPNAA